MGTPWGKDELRQLGVQKMNSGRRREGKDVPRAVGIQKMDRRQEGKNERPELTTIFFLKCRLVLVSNNLNLK